MDQTTVIEKRQHRRIEHRVPVKLGTLALDLVTETKNISCSGAYCRVNKYLEPMTKLKVTLLVPNKTSGRIATRKIICTGVVVRTENIPYEDAFNIAIFFSDINSRDSQVLADHVNIALMENKGS